MTLLSLTLFIAALAAPDTTESRFPDRYVEVSAQHVTQSSISTGIASLSAAQAVYRSSKIGLYGGIGLEGRRVGDSGEFALLGFAPVLVPISTHLTAEVSPGIRLRRELVGNFRRNKMLISGALAVRYRLTKSTALRLSMEGFKARGQELESAQKVGLVISI